MTRLVLLGGAPNRNLARLGAELASRDGARAVNFRFAAMFERLREAALHRATVWQGVHARPVEWIEPAVRRLAPLVARRLAGDASLAVNVHTDNALRLEMLAAALPEAQFVVLVRDGMVVDDELPSPVDACEWARTWASHVEPFVRLESKLGAKLLLVRDEDLVAEPERELARVLDFVRCVSPREWCGERPSASSRLASEALEGFAAHEPALELQRRFGYAVPTAGAVCERHPRLVKERVRSLLAAQRVDEARQLVERALWLQRSAPALEALGLVEARAGRETQAVHAFLGAIQLDASSVDAWIELFRRPTRPELLAIAEFPRHSPEVRVRSAFARWLVTRGLDPEAAEVVANVAHQPWQTPQ